MRRLAELVADVIDDMLAADFEDGFAGSELPHEFPGAETAFRELISASGALPYDWSTDAGDTFGFSPRGPWPLAGWERRHAQASLPATPRPRRTRPGQVAPPLECCATPVRTRGENAPPCH